jgi:metal-responsive CopG/Arc/MetJ family transcriptional regulator
VTVVSSYQKLVNVSFKIEADLLAELDALARERNMSRSEVIRRAIAWYVKSYSKPAVTPRMTVYDASNNPDTSMPRIRFR